MGNSKYIECVDCGREFEFTERDKKFFNDRGFQEPGRRNIPLTAILGSIVSEIFPSPRSTISWNP